MKLTPSQQHTIIYRPHVAHLALMFWRTGQRESIDRPALAWLEMERQAGLARVAISQKERGHDG